MTTKVHSQEVGSASSKDPSTISGDDFTDRHGSNSIFVPALGESWAHATTSRILLSFSKENEQGNGAETNKSKRICKLVKSPHKAAGKASFGIYENGIRDSTS